MKRRVAWTAFVILSAQFTVGTPAYAYCSNTTGYHYAFQYTAQTTGQYGPPTCNAAAGYYGWIGVDGRITAPSHFPVLNDVSREHWLNYHAMKFPNDGFVQEGYYGGVLSGPGSSCTPRTSVLGNYEEYWMNPTVSQTYFCYDFRDVAFNHPAVFRIEFNSISQCWDVFYDYNHFLDDPCYGSDTYGAGYSVAEIFDCHDGDATCGSATRAPEMPLTVSGYSDPNTNDAMRLLGAHGYEPWDATLTAKYTATYDERSMPKSYHYSPFVAFYKFETYTG